MLKTLKLLKGFNLLSVPHYRSSFLNGCVSFRKNKESLRTTNQSPSKIQKLSISFEKARLALDKVTRFLNSLRELCPHTYQTVEIMRLLLDVYHQCK